MADEDLPRLLSGRYRLEATLGHGGMGVVYRGVDLMMKRPIAVKLIRAVDGVGLDEEIAGRFLREAKNTARLQHEHIVEVFDLGRTEEGGLYFVMELLEGESLSARLRREGALSPETTVHIGRQICDALQAAHAAGIVHRDLKPANVMLLSRAGDPEFVKVLDFGVAKSYASDQETQLTHTGMLVGTVDYMAPEQIMGKPVDGRTDVYSLGVVLYKMLSGHAPFRDTGVAALIHAHLNTMPKPLIEVVPGIPNELDRVVLRCLAKNPDRRYESMAELRRALTMALMPEDANLIDLEYGRSDADPYSSDDKTVMGRPYSARLAPDDATVNEGKRVVEEEVQFEDATVKIDRPLRPPPAARAGGAPPPPVTPRSDLAVPRRSLQGRPADARRPEGGPLYPEDVLTAKRPFGAEVRQSEPRTCAMCQTVNAPHARACVACGVSLLPADQEAVRARVRATEGPGVGPAVVPLPATSSSGYELSSVPPGPPAYPPPSGPYGPPSPTHGVPAVPWAPPPPSPPAPPPSMWQRFLAWTGLRGR
jgi:serine/threonine-protein kinase